MAEEIRYKNAMETHGLKGTAIPAARGTGEIGTPVSKGDLGATFDTQAPVVQNVIVADKDGERVVARIDAAALSVLRTKNKGGHAVTYEDAVLISKQGEYAEAVVKPQTAPEVAPAKKARRRSPAPATPKMWPMSSVPSQPAQSYSPEQSEPGQVSEAPKVKVKFTGPFGTFSYPFTSINREGIYLIMVQFDEEGNFFEAPMSSDLVEVQVGSDRLMCYPGPQFRLTKDGKIFVTVYMIDQKATEGVQS